MDSLDSEIEDASELLQKIFESLCAIGFSNPIIVPISASAACLFRMALRSERMTGKNRLDLKNKYHYFIDMEQDFRKLVNISYPSSIVQCMYENITVDERILSKQGVLEAIERTGVPLMEKIIENKIEGEV